jgi:hypothetical protein
VTSRCRDNVGFAREWIPSEVCARSMEPASDAGTTGRSNRCAASPSLASGVVRDPGAPLSRATGPVEVGARRRSPCGSSLFALDGRVGVHGVFRGALAFRRTSFLTPRGRATCCLGSRPRIVLCVPSFESSLPSLVRAAPPQGVWGLGVLPPEITGSAPCDQPDGLRPRGKDPIEALVRWPSPAPSSALEPLPHLSMRLRLRPSRDPRSGANVHL